MVEVDPGPTADDRLDEPLLSVDGHLRSRIAILLRNLVLADRPDLRLVVLPEGFAGGNSHVPGVADLRSDDLVLDGPEDVALPEHDRPWGELLVVGVDVCFFGYLRLRRIHEVAVLDGPRRVIELDEVPFREAVCLVLGFGLVSRLVDVGVQRFGFGFDTVSSGRFLGLFDGFVRLVDRLTRF